MAKKNKNDRFSLYTVRTVDRDIRLPHSYDCHRLVSSAQCYAFLILTLFPLLIGPETYINITKTKFAAFVVLTCLLLRRASSLAFSRRERTAFRGRALYRCRGLRCRRAF